MVLTGGDHCVANRKRSLKAPPLIGSSHYKHSQGFPSGLRGLSPLHHVCSCIFIPSPALQPAFMTKRCEIVRYEAVQKGSCRHLTQKKKKVEESSRMNTAHPRLPLWSPASLKHFIEVCANRHDLRPALTID